MRPSPRVSRSAPRVARPPRAHAGLAHLVPIALALVAVIAGMAGLTGCGGHRAASGCARLAPATAPDTDGTLGTSNNGQHFCLHVGQAVGVFLKADAVASGRWSAVTSSDPAVLHAENSGVLTAVIGVTPGIFRAVAAGTARLDSNFAGPPAGTWSVTITATG